MTRYFQIKNKNMIQFPSLLVMCYWTVDVIHTVSSRPIHARRLYTRRLNTRRLYTRRLNTRRPYTLRLNTRRLDARRRRLLMNHSDAKRESFIF